MIDLHCHLLPGADDGPATLADSIAMARAAYQDGVQAVIVTPHEGPWLEQHPGPDAGSVLRAQVGALEEEIRRAGLPLALYPGMEVVLDMDLPQRLQSGRAVPLAAGPYILVELPMLQRPLYMERVVFELQVQGWRPILAHAERYPYVQEAPELLVPLVERGLLIQITVRSLTGAVGRPAQQTARRLLRRDMVHCLASDGHAASGPRAPVLTPGLQVAARLVGPARSRALVTELAGRVLGHGGVGVPQERDARR